MAIGKDGSKVMSLRLPDKAYRRHHAYGVTKDLSDSAAARELIDAGLASDGLALYSTELGGYLRGVMQPLLEQLDRTHGERNAEKEDRIARVRLDRGIARLRVGLRQARDVARTGQGDEDRRDRSHGADRDLRERPVEGLGCLRIHGLAHSLVYLSHWIGPDFRVIRRCAAAGPAGRSARPVIRRS